MSVDASTPTLRQEWTGAFFFSPCTAGIGGGLGYLGTWCFTAISPPLGAAYLATQFVVHTFVNPVFDKFLSSEKFPVLSSSLSFSATFISSAVLSKLLFDAAGTVLTVGNMATIITASAGVVLLAIGVSVVSLAVFALLAKCLCKERWNACQERVASA